MPRLELGTERVLMLDPNACFGVPSDIVLGKVMSDGRVMGLLMEHILADQFSNLKYVGGCGTHDLLMDEGLKIECKVSGSNSFNIAPSNMVGKGRKFDDNEFVKRLNILNGFICVYLGNAPIMHVYAIHRDVYVKAKYYLNASKTSSNLYTPTLSREKCMQLTRRVQGLIVV
jgi:hypothetical protein